MTEETNPLPKKPISKAEERQPNPKPSTTDSGTAKPAANPTPTNKPATSPAAPPSPPDQKPAPTVKTPEQEIINEKEKQTADEKPVEKISDNSAAEKTETVPKTPDPKPVESTVAEPVKKNLENNILKTESEKPRDPSTPLRLAQDDSTEQTAPLPEKTKPEIEKPEIIETTESEKTEKEEPQELESAPTPSPLKKPVNNAPAPATTPKHAPVKTPVFSHQNLLVKLKEFRQKANQKRTQNKENNLKKVKEFALENNKITNDDVEIITGVKHWQAANYLKELTQKKKLVRFGKKSNTFYKPVK